MKRNTVVALRCTKCHRQNNLQIGSRPSQKETERIII